MKRAMTHTGLNALIQGSSADITKAAMVKIWESGILEYIDLKLTVHDELDFSVHKDQQKCLNEAIHLMQNAVDLSVPLKVDVEKGDSWGTIK
jgi:DNA polymerase I-like protein with 3'-5' exonuclease and polymerase domains